MGIPVKDDMIVLYNKMSNEDKMFMLELMAKDINVAVEVTHNGKPVEVFCLDLNTEVPVFINGTLLQVNLEQPIDLIDNEHSK